MADILKPDLCVIGAGGLGIALALKASQRGLGVILVERPDSDGLDPPGGWLRHAAFLAAAERAQAIRTAGRLGFDNAAPKPNFRAIGEHADAVAAAIEARDSAARLTALGIKVLKGDASFADKQTLRIGDVTIRARQFALATGSLPQIPALPGLDQVPFFTPDTIKDNIRKLSHLVVIGGTPGALELAQAYHRLGAQVTVVPQGGLLLGFDAELVAQLVRHLRDEGVVIHEGAAVTAITPRSQGTGISLHSAEGDSSLDVSHILVAMDRLPLLDAAFLDKAKLRRDLLRPDHLQVSPNGQSSSARITALGGAAGTPEPHIGMRQATLLVERLLGHGKGDLDPAVAPRYINTSPPLAQIGTDIGELAAGQSVLRQTFAETDAARAVGDVQGSVKLVVGRNGAVQRAAAFGVGAGDIIALLTIAMARGLPLDDLAALALPQPSLAAVLVDLADKHRALQPAKGWARRLPGLGRNAS